MRNQRQKCIAIKGPLFAALLLIGSAAWAQVAGTVVHLSGLLLAKKADGTVKVLAVKSEVMSGDTLVSEKGTYAQVRFIDDSQMTLRPGTTIHIENFAFEAGKPDGDSAAFNLLKGGLRWTTGQLGKRNKDRFALKTPDAAIGIRGTTFIAQYVPPPPQVNSPGSTGLDGNLTRGELVRDLVNGLNSANTNAGQGKSPAGSGGGDVPLAPPGSGLLPVTKVNNGGGSPSSPPTLAPGLHLQVTDGAIVVTNSGGSLGFQAGQFGYVPSVNQPPVIVPSNPGLQFVPPPSFNGNSGPTASNGPGQGQATDCIVR